jgi:hypothetical protein
MLKSYKPLISIISTAATNKLWRKFRAAGGVEREKSNFSLSMEVFLFPTNLNYGSTTSLIIKTFYFMKKKIQ